MSDEDRRQLYDLTDRLIYIERRIDSAPMEATKTEVLGVPKRPQAPQPELFPQGLPKNKELVECILTLVTQRDGTKADFDILLPKFSGDGKLVKEMQAEIRRARHEGIHTLPDNSKRRKRTN